MKRIASMSIAAVLLLISIQSAAWAQTITIDSISGTQFCAGDPLSVTFTVVGMWGHNNAFTLQLSDTSGSFTTGGFTILGSKISSSAGTFNIISTIPIRTDFSAHYRVRITGAYPYTESADNGSNIEIGAAPDKLLPSEFGVFPAPPTEPLAIGVPHHFRYVSAYEMGLQDYGTFDSVFVNYGPGAIPAVQTFSGSTLADVMNYLSVTYFTSGLKLLITKSFTQGGCYAIDTFWFYVYDCAIPSVPHDAIIVGDLASGDTSVAGALPHKTYWVNPGVSFMAAEFDTIFAESGARIIGQHGGSNIVYLKPGATSDLNTYGVVIYAPGAGVDKSGDSDGDPTIECDNLKFDYSQAPANSVMGINELVTPASPMQPIAVSPNPTEGIVTLRGVPARAEITVMNVLGETVQNVTAQSDMMTLDFSKLARGSYYIRIAAGASVVTKKVVKE